MTGWGAWQALLAAFMPVFNAPSFDIFMRVAGAWVACPGRRTITRLYALAEPSGQRAHDAYHRFFREADWQGRGLWKILATLLVAAFHRAGVIPLDLDDTLYHKSGRKVAGAGWWRDAVRSTGTRVVHGFGLNILVLTLRVEPPWGGEPLGLPVNLRIHLKGGPTLLALAQEAIRETVAWFPDRSFSVCGDGFFAPLLGAAFPPEVVLTSRIRRDAAIYDLPPKKRPHTRGAPRKKGQRLPTPEGMARQSLIWRRKTVTLRGKATVRLVYARTVLWYAVSHSPVLLVICRDPAGKEKDDFFCTTDIAAAPAKVVETYAGRWSIEDTFKYTKQLLGGETPQSWKKHGPQRAAILSFALYSLVWAWYLQTQGNTKTWKAVPWYPLKRSASFANALAHLRRTFWRQRIIASSDKSPVLRKFLKDLIEVLALAV